MIYLCNYRTKEVNTYGIRVAISPPPEGYEYGLEVNDEVDERYNIEKETVAACKYLKEAYPSKAMLNTVDEKAYRQKYFRVINPNLYKIRDLLRALCTYGNVYLLANSTDHHGQILAEKLKKLNVIVKGLRP